MTKTHKIAIWAALGVAVGALAGVITLKRSRFVEIRVLTGTVLTQDEDVNKQVPIPNTEIRMAGGLAEGSSKTDSAGLFVVRLRAGIFPGRIITLQFRHMGYQPLDLRTRAGNQLYIVRMQPLPRDARAKGETPVVGITNIRVRYTVPSTNIVNVGSTVKTFQVVNTGNVPCDQRGPCSPDGKWKAVADIINSDLPMTSPAAAPAT